VSQVKPEALNIRERLEHFAGQAGLRQTVIAELCGVTDSAVSFWFSGRSEPSHENLAAFCRACGITLEVFWGQIRQAG
jgi:transcriptional regulator with XRE-family HTH domain